MKKGKFYVLKEDSNLLKEKNAVYALIETNAIDNTQALLSKQIFRR